MLGGNSIGTDFYVSILCFIGEGASMSIFKKFKKFYKASAENRIQIHLFLGFVIIPVLGMSILYLLVRIFWM